MNKRKVEDLFGQANLLHNQLIDEIYRNLVNFFDHRLIYYTVVCSTSSLDPIEDGSESTYRTFY